MVLMHKDTPVAKIKMTRSIPTGVEEIIIPEHLPIGLGQKLETADINIITWHTRRSIPTGRIGGEKLFEILGRPEELSVRSFGLSLTDCYWYKSEEYGGLTWDDVSLHKNGFTPDIFLYMSGKLIKQDISPDYTTDGCLAKFWTLDASGPWLVKSGDIEGITKKTGILAANEVAACRIAGLMGVPHAGYKIVHTDFSESPWVATRCFVENDQLEFIPASSLKEQYQETAFASDREALKLFSKLGMEEDVRQMGYFDLLIANSDRHLSNFGYLRDAETLKPIGFAPLFDSGSCLGWDKTMNPEIKPLYKPRNSLLKDVPVNAVPEKNEVIEIIRGAYEEAGVPEDAFEQASDIIQAGYSLIKKNIPVTYQEPEL